jgi:hypothetical protein
LIYLREFAYFKPIFGQSECKMVASGKKTPLYRMKKIYPKLVTSCGTVSRSCEAGVIVLLYYESYTCRLHSIVVVIVVVAAPPLPLLLQVWK